MDCRHSPLNSHRSSWASHGPNPFTAIRNHLNFQVGNLQHMFILHSRASISSSRGEANCHSLPLIGNLALTFPLLHSRPRSYSTVMDCTCCVLMTEKLAFPSTSPLRDISSSWDNPHRRPNLLLNSRYLNSKLCFSN